MYLRALKFSIFSHKFTERWSVYLHCIMEIIKSAKSGSKVCYNGHMYTKKKCSLHRIRWECSRKNTLSCSGAITTNSAIFSTFNHCHDTDYSSIEAAKVRNKLKQTCHVIRGSNSQILTGALQNCSSGARCAIGKVDTLKRNIRRHKRGGLPNEPQSLSQLVIQEEWTTTGGQGAEPFVIYDNGINATNRMLVFATECGLRHLCRVHTWFMDGTFSSAPKLFKQVYVLRAPL